MLDVKVADKAIKIIRSCSSIEQCDVAGRWLRLAELGRKLPFAIVDDLEHLLQLRRELCRLEACLNVYPR